MVSREYLVRRLGRLLLAALTIALLALATRGLRTFVEGDALAAIEATESTSGDALRMTIAIDAAHGTANARAPSKHWAPATSFAYSHQPATDSPIPTAAPAKSLGFSL